MDFCKIYLGKSIHQLEFNFIREYFLNTPLQESNTIEYKSYNPAGEFNSKLNGLKIAICSFLNSDGGILIWGSPRGKKD